MKQLKIKEVDLNGIQFITFEYEGKQIYMSKTCWEFTKKLFYPEPAQPVIPGKDFPFESYRITFLDEDK